MNVSQTILDFKSRFKILDVIDLYQDANELTNRLLSIKKYHYANDEKILVLQLKEDEYTYPDQPGTFLTLLQKKLRDLDISNYFVTILSGNPDIDQELEQARVQYSTDDVPIQSFRIDQEYHKKIKKFQDTYCVLPWMHFFVGPNGDVLPCCRADQNLPFGNLFDSTVQEIMTSESALKVKSNMINGLRSKSCESCYVKEDNNLPSPRIHYNQEFNTHVSTDVLSYTPVWLNIELNHLCNFKCRMCNEWFSSSIAQETKIMYGSDAKLPGHYIGISQLDSVQRKPTLEKILKNLNQVEQISFGGGEPLLSQEHYSILSTLIELDQTDIEIYYNTNLSKLQFKNIKVTDLWKKFDNITVGASIDASDSAAEYIRHGTVWKDIINNIDQVRLECPNVKLQINSTVGFLNVQNLIKLQQQWVATNYLPPECFRTSCLITPEFLSVTVLPEVHKKRLEEEISNHIRWCQRNFANTLIPDWQNIINYMMSTDHSHLLDEFKKRMKILDHHRGESLLDIFPEFWDLY